jgi:predicted nucleic acid-binding protein
MLLLARGEELCYTPQILAEFWNVATRPAAARGGLGLSVIMTERKARIIERHFRLLPDSLAVHQEWRRLIVAYSIQGVQVYDARLIASMNTHGVSRIITFNKDDFTRFAGISVLTPAEVI